MANRDFEMDDMMCSCLAFPRGSCHTLRNVSHFDLLATVIEHHVGVES